MNTWIYRRVRAALSVICPAAAMKPMRPSGIKLNYFKGAPMNARHSPSIRPKRTPSNSPSFDKRTDTAEAQMRMRVTNSPHQRLKNKDTNGREEWVVYLKILPRNSFISFQLAVSAAGLYSIGILNFLPVSVEAGLVKAWVAPAYSLKT
jgi:hypothetical protein